MAQRYLKERNRVLTLIDTHAHLDHTDDARLQLQEAAKAGVCAVIAAGVDLAANQIHLKLAKECQNPDSIFLREKVSGNRDVRISSENIAKVSAPHVFLAFGIHPGNIIAEQIDETISFIREHKSEAVAIGEIGLDFWYPWMKKNEEKKQEQFRVFQLQLDLANAFDLPVIIHSRGAWRECFTMTKAAGIKRAVFHWYSGPTDVLKDILENGYFISATPALHYSPPLQEAVRLAPIEQTLIETDTPVVYRISKEHPLKAGPKDVFVTLDAYAQIKGVDKEKAAGILNANAKKFFNLLIS